MKKKEILDYIPQRQEVAATLDTSFKQIFGISVPIMLGSAAQNVIAVTDGVFMGRVGEVEMGAIGFVSAFYLIVAAIGYGFSKGGQIMIARRLGENKLDAIGRTAYSMLYFEFAMAVLMFLFIKFGSYPFFSLFVSSDEIFYKSLEYIDYRAYGVFFSYVGVAIIALYTGVARTAFIIFDTLLLLVVNVVLDYGLVFGAWGLPAMGIAGAGLASTLAEVAAFIAFLIYIIFDKESRRYKLFTLPKIDIAEIKTMLRISLPIVAQMVVSLGSAFFFFAIVENLGERALAAGNVVRLIYLCLSIPCWGFCSGINTMVSNVIGQGRRDVVTKLIVKTAILCFGMTMLITLPVMLFPDIFMGVFTTEQGVIDLARPTVYILATVLVFFSIGSIIFNAIIGIGATMQGLKIMTISAIAYIIMIYVIIVMLGGGLKLAWSAEILYWVIMMLFSIWFLRFRDWKGIKV